MDKLNPPLAEYLALGRTHIDYFSLDVEGAELQILETIPFDKLTIDVLTIEFAVVGSEEAGARKLENIRRLFNETGLYTEVGILMKGDVAFKRIGT